MIQEKRKMPYISIIVPIYNVEKYLRECIDSILVQKFKDFELILVNDGSEDGCGKICDEYALKDSRITVVHKKNGGVVSARKCGIELAKGLYILNVDSDDYISEDLLCVLEKECRKYNEPDIIIFDHRKTTENGRPMKVFRNKYEGYYDGEELNTIKKKLLYDTNLKKFNYGSFSVMIWNKMMKRSLATDCQFAVPNSIVYGEDTSVTIPAINKCKSLYVKRHVGYYYRERGNSIAHDFTKYAIIDFMDVIAFLEKEEFGIPKDHLAGYCLRIFNYHMLKAAVSLPSVRSFSSYGDEVFTDWFQKRFQDFPSSTLNLIYRTVFYLITHKKWVLLWVLYKSIHTYR